MAPRPARYNILSDDTKTEIMDHTEAAIRTRADEKVLEALAREHPERAVTDWSEPGTKSPRRITPPGDGSVRSSMDG